jgi:hypothetical protein
MNCGLAWNVGLAWIVGLHGGLHIRSLQHCLLKKLNRLHNDAETIVLACLRFALPLLTSSHPDLLPYTSFRS